LKGERKMKQLIINPSSDDRILPKTTIPIKMMIAGEPGVGKTTMALTFSKPL